MSFKEYFYVAIFCFVMAIPLTFIYEEIDEKRKSDMEKRQNDSLTNIKVKLEIELLKNKLKHE